MLKTNFRSVSLKKELEKRFPIWPNNTLQKNMS